MKMSLRVVMAGILLLGGIALPAVQGAIIDTLNVTSSSDINSDKRAARNLLVNSTDNPLGIDISTGVFSISSANGGDGWQSNDATQSTMWLAFDLGAAANIESLYIWNYAGAIDTRQVKSFDIYTVSPSAVTALGSDFSTYFPNYTAASGNGGRGSYNFSDTSIFTPTDISVSLPQIKDTALRGYPHQIDADISDAQWVVFTNFTSYGGDNYLGLSKVAFLDETPAPDWVQPVKAVARSTYTAMGDGTNRNVKKTIDGTGLAPVNIFNPGKGETHVYTSASDADAAWLSPQGDAANQWLAFDLGGSYDLEGLYAWNYSRSGLMSRGISDFEIYAVTQSDLDALSGVTFDNFFEEGGLLVDLLASPLLTKVNPDPGKKFSMAAAENNFAQQQEFLFEDTISDVAWVLMAIEGKTGATDYIGLGQVQFFGSPHSSDSAVPEPATWVLLVFGLAGGWVVSRRKPARPAGA